MGAAPHRIAKPGEDSNSIEFDLDPSLAQRRPQEISLTGENVKGISERG